MIIMYFYLPLLRLKEGGIRHAICSSWSSTPGVFKVYLLKGHILMAERFAGRIRVLQSKVCILLQDIRTNISLHKYT
jgi:hypothetical protein